MTSAQSLSFIPGPGEATEGHITGDTAITLPDPPGPMPSGPIPAGFPLETDTVALCLGPAQLPLWAWSAWTQGQACLLREEAGCTRQSGVSCWWLLETYQPCVQAATLPT